MKPAFLLTPPTLHGRGVFSKQSLVFLIFCIGFLFLCGAASSEGVQQSPEARKKAVTILKAIKQDKWDYARALSVSAKDRLTTKLYYWMAFQDGGHKESGNFSRLAQFIKGNPQWPRIELLQEQAEKAMPGSMPPKEIAAWFKAYPPQTARGLDLYLSALAALGHGGEARKMLGTWWAETLMPRDDQRTIYKKYGAMISRSAHLRRFDRLLFAEQYTNARAIAAVLGEGYSALAEARIGLAEENGDPKALINKIPAKLRSDPGLLYERLRWRRRHDLDMEAIDILHNAPPPSQIQNPDDWWTEQHILIRRLLEKRMYESAYLLARKHFQTEGLSYSEAEWMAGWMALRFMNRPAQAFTHFENIFTRAKTAITKARGAYWAARAAKAMGKNDMAAIWYKKAAPYQTVFYGQLAGAALGQGHQLPNAAPPVLTDSDKAAINAHELVQAAKIFHAAGMRKESSLFLKTFVEHFKTPKNYRFAAELASGMRQYGDAIKIAKDATNEGMFLTAQSYPVITEKLGKVEVEWALVHALIRQESMFDDDALSPAGAVGLMQVMPATGREVAKKLGIGFSKGSLASPDYNIRIGAAYMQRLLAKYKGSYPLAIAAYNAGPGRVDGWLETFGDPREGKIGMIDWIEMIPIYETRNYVHRVMEGVFVYRLRLKNKQKPPTATIHVSL